MKITKKNNKTTIFKKSQKSWTEIVKDMPAFPDFNVGRKDDLKSAEYLSIMHNPTMKETSSTNEALVSARKLLKKHLPVFKELAK